MQSARLLECLFTLSCDLLPCWGLLRGPGGALPGSIDVCFGADPKDTASLKPLQSKFKIEGWFVCFLAAINPWNCQPVVTTHPSSVPLGHLPSQPPGEVGRAGSPLIHSHGRRKPLGTAPLLGRGHPVRLPTWYTQGLALCPQTLYIQQDQSLTLGAHRMPSGQRWSQDSIPLSGFLLSLNSDVVDPNYLTTSFTISVKFFVGSGSLRSK